MSFRYAWRMGMFAAKTRPQTTSSASASQNEPTSASSARIPALVSAPRISEGVRFSKSAGIRAAGPAQDLRAGDERRREAGDRVRVRVAVEFQQIRLQRVEGVDADPGRER